MQKNRRSSGFGSFGLLGQLGQLGVLGLLSFGALLCGCKDQNLQKECAAFPGYAREATGRAAAAVPEATRKAQTSPAERAAWHRKLASAFEQEQSAAPRFTQERVKGFESKLKQAYGMTAAALRKTADGFEKNDKELVEQGQRDDVNATGVRDAVVADAERNCAQ